MKIGVLQLDVLLAQQIGLPFDLFGFR